MTSSETERDPERLCTIHKQVELISTPKPYATPTQKPESTAETLAGIQEKKKKKEKQQPKKLTLYTHHTSTARMLCCLCPKLTLYTHNHSAPGICYLLQFINILRASSDLWHPAINKIGLTVFGLINTLIKRHLTILTLTNICITICYINHNSTGVFSA